MDQVEQESMMMSSGGSKMQRSPSLRLFDDKVGGGALGYPYTFRPVHMLGSLKIFNLYADLI